MSHHYNLWSGWYKSMFSSAEAAIILFCFVFLSHWTAPKTALSDWLLWRGPWKYPALWLDPGRLWFSLMETAVGERGVTEKEAWLWWCWWSFYQSLCYRCTCSPRNYVSLAKVWEVHKANLTMVFLHFSLGLNSIVVCLSLQLLIMMSILSYLLGSAWLLISSQHSSATLLVPAPTTQQKLSLFFLSSSFFSFLDNDLLPVVCCYTSCWVSPNKNLTRASEVVSTIHFWQQTANPSLLFNKWKVFL